VTTGTRVRVLAFARVAELLGSREERLELAAEARVSDAWSALARKAPALCEIRASTRAACNGRIVPFDAPVADGDELAFLPPVGGG
jgi:molybdopterin synthase sulfur carrier subunit